MILEVQFQIVGACRCTRGKVFIFKIEKIPGGQILIFFCENQHKALFYIKQQTQEYKFKIWVLKTTIWTPEKAHFWFLMKNPQKFFLSSCFGFDLALKTIDTQMSFWLVFLKMH